jgi:hypothetical protein
MLEYSNLRYFSLCGFVTVEQTCSQWRRSNIAWRQTKIPNKMRKAAQDGVGLWRFASNIAPREYQRSGELHIATISACQDPPASAALTAGTSFVLFGRG